MISGGKKKLIMQVFQNHHPSVHTNKSLHLIDILINQLKNSTYNVIHFTLKFFKSYFNDIIIIR